MAKTKQRTIARRNRASAHSRKRRAKIARRPPVRREEEKAAAVIANSAFAVTLAPKTWASIAKDSCVKEDPRGADIYRDLAQAYNHGAELIGIEKIVLKTGIAWAADVAEVLNLFKRNICPDGFDVNIDEHYNKKTRKQHFHFTVYNTTEFPAYWHFFEIKPVVNLLLKTNKKLHDLFIVFIRSFIYYCNIPTWFEGPVVNCEFILSDYVRELRDLIKKEASTEVKEAVERTGYTVADMKQRLADIEATMKEYATGQAQEYMQKIIKAKILKPHYILRTLKKFPGQHKLVKFMKNACELMKNKVGVTDFSYHYTEGYDDEGLNFDEQVAIIWDWSDHYSACQAKNIQQAAYGLGVFSPTLAARFMPSGTFDLEYENLQKHLDWPKKLSALQVQFQEITERFTNYEKERDLL